jgi:hypothetical protein
VSVSRILLSKKTVRLPEQQEHVPESCPTLPGRMPAVPQDLSQETAGRSQSIRKSLFCMVLCGQSPGKDGTLKRSLPPFPQRPDQELSLRRQLPGRLAEQFVVGLGFPEDNPPFP